MVDAAPSPFTRDLARRLLAIEASGNGDTDGHAHETVRVCEKLRLAVTRFAGADGFASLLRRSLALAKAHVPSLNGLQIKTDGCLEDLATVPDGNDAAVAIVAHLLDLLVTFVGRPLTLRLLKEAWPDTPWNT